MSAAAPRYSVAVDLGSSNGKILLGIVSGQELKTVEIHRFDHSAVERNGGLYWDWQHICAEVIRGLRLAAAAAPPGAIEAVSCDSWAQDFGLLDESGNILETPRCYRDPAFAATVPLIDALRSREDQLNLNALCAAPITTLNQLLYLNRYAPETYSRCRKILHVADLLHHLLGGTVTGDPTLLGISQLYNIRSGTVDVSLLNALGLDPAIVPQAADGIIGSITHPELRELFPHAKLIAGAGHDTAAAFAGARVKENEFFISMGSWLMCGSRLDDLSGRYPMPGALLTLCHRKTGFFNGSNGMYLVQRCCAKWKREAQGFSFAELDAEAEASRCEGSFNIDDPEFSDPEADVPEIIRQKAVPNCNSVSRGDILRLININLSSCIRQEIERQNRLRRQNFTGAVMVSGGIRNRELVANFTARTGLPLRCGEQEASAAGNLLNAFETLAAN